MADTSVKARTEKKRMAGSVLQQKQDCRSLGENADFPSFYSIIGQAVGRDKEKVDLASTGRWTLGRPASPSKVHSMPGLGFDYLDDALHGGIDRRRDIVFPAQFHYTAGKNLHFGFPAGVHILQHGGLALRRERR